MLLIELIIGIQTDTVIITVFDKCGKTDKLNNNQNSKIREIIPANFF